MKKMLSEFLDGLLHVPKFYFAYALVIKERSDLDKRIESSDLPENEKKELTQARSSLDDGWRYLKKRNDLDKLYSPVSAGVLLGIGAATYSVFGTSLLDTIAENPSLMAFPIVTNLATKAYLSAKELYEENPNNSPI